MMNIERAIELFEKARLFALEGAADGGAREAVCAECPEVYPASIRGANGVVFAMLNLGGGVKKFIAASSERASVAAAGFVPETTGVVACGGVEYFYQICGTSAENASALRKQFSFTAPVRGGLAPAIGLGDRTGIATPGHIRAVRGRDIFPVLAQQSVREMHRTARSPQQVMDDVSWAVFQEGFERPFGSDADHLKSAGDIRTMANAGFTMFTIDPSEYIDAAAGALQGGALSDAFDSLFGGDAAKRGELIARYDGRAFKLPCDGGGEETISIGAEELMRIAVTYLPAVRHTVEMARLLEELCGGGGYDLEVSVDETDAPTTPEAHLFVALELRENGVTPQSVAPRFTGEFQKGIDFIGDIDEFTRTARLHAMIARAFGPYKLSIHSGSDKFSVFPIIARLTGGLFHEKTAGTSYLEAVRVIARRNPSLYREMHEFALGRFAADRASYHVTTDLSAIPPLESLADGQLPALMDDVNARQLMHITYGSALTEPAPGGGPLFRDRMFDTLHANEEEHYETLAAHIVRHLDALRVATTD